MKLLTFDIEDWFHIRFERNFNTYENFDRLSHHSIIEKNLDIILQRLDEYNISATFFCLGWIGEKHPHLIKKIHSLGHEIASHTHMHNLLYNLNEKENKKDLKKSIQVLENLTGEKIISFRAPAFSMTEEVNYYYDLLLENGIENDCSIFGSKRDFGGNKDMDFRSPFLIKTKSNKIIREFPISYTKILNSKIIFTGGGYFRVFPSLLFPIFDRSYQKHPYQMYYLHPRDFDSTHPILEGLSFRRKLFSYTGLRTTERKFETILKLNRFINVKEAAKTFNWNKCETVEI